MRSIADYGSLSTLRKWRRQARFRLFVILSAALGSFSLPATAQAPYPSSSSITASPLQAAKRERLSNLLTAPPAAPIRDRTRKELCPPEISPATVTDSSVKQALAIVENSIATEILFERPAREGETTPTRFSFLVEFSPTRVLIQHLNARYPRESNGYSAPFLYDRNRVVWYEGKMGTDMLVFIPSVRDCNVQGVVLCPRSYVPHNTLVASHFTPIAIREMISARADGLFSPSANVAGKVQASILATSNISLPERWFNSTVSTKDPASVTKYQTPRGDREKLPPFVTTTLPWVAALESRLDFGREIESLRTSTKRLTVEVSEYSIPSYPQLAVGHSEFSVEGGTCYLVAEWSESQL